MPARSSRRQFQVHSSGTPNGLLEGHRSGMPASEMARCPSIIRSLMGEQYAGCIRNQRFRTAPGMPRQTETDIPVFIGIHTCAQCLCRMKQTFFVNSVFPATQTMRLKCAVLRLRQHAPKACSRRRRRAQAYEKIDNSLFSTTIGPHALRIRTWNAGGIVCRESSAKDTDVESVSAKLPAAKHEYSIPLFCSRGVVHFQY